MNQKKPKAGQIKIKKAAIMTDGSFLNSKRGSNI
jgi:hypothetical protein